MSNDDKLQNQQNRDELESHVQMDQDHGNMNNGTIGGNMGVIGNTSEEDNKKDIARANDTPAAAE